MAGGRPTIGIVGRLGVEGTIVINVGLGVATATGGSPSFDHIKEKKSKKIKRAHLPVMAHCRRYAGAGCCRQTRLRPVNVTSNLVKCQSHVLPDFCPSDLSPITVTRELGSACSASKLAHTLVNFLMFLTDLSRNLISCRVSAGALPLMHCSGGSSSSRKAGDGGGWG